MYRRLTKFRATRWVVATGLLAYVAPLAVPLVARFGHEAYHAVHELQRVSGTAQLLGIAWVDPGQDPEPGARMHTHGDGSPAHSHAPGLDLLMAAADPGATLLPSLPQPDRVSAHVPAASVLLTVRAVLPVLVSQPSAPPVDGRSLRPPLPPPRA